MSNEMEEAFRPSRLRGLLDHFQACFTDWALSLRPDAPKLIAINGQTSRRTHDRAASRRALHLVSA